MKKSPLTGVVIQNRLEGIALDELAITLILAITIGVETQWKAPLSLGGGICSLGVIIY